MASMVKASRTGSTHAHGSCLELCSKLSTDLTNGSGSPEYCQNEIHSCYSQALFPKEVTQLLPESIFSNFTYVRELISKLCKEVKK